LVIRWSALSDNTLLFDVITSFSHEFIAICMNFS
jgi:hypothetical protein